MIDACVWARAIDGVGTLLSAVFRRADLWDCAMRFVRALLAELPRKNCWTLAEAAEMNNPHRFQHLLGRAKWDTGEAVDLLRGYVVGALGARDAILVVDETGDVKKGTATVGVQRQYTGTAGRIENAQVAVYLAYATADAHALIDTRLYMPESWMSDPGRCVRASVPAGLEFATKGALAREMIGEVLDAGVECSWVAGDEGCGADPVLRADLQRRAVGYVLAVASNRVVDPGKGRMRVDAAARLVPRSAWNKMSAGTGTKGERWYQWAWMAISSPNTDPAGSHHLLIRRNEDTGELAYYLCFTPGRARLGALVKVAGRRWRIEESFQTSKGLTGLDQHQVRTWTSWHRWTALAMWAYALLAAATLAARAREGRQDAMVRLSVPELRHLVCAALQPPTVRLNQAWRWSWWRRRHQHQSQQSHRNRRSGGKIPL
jgi:SRSO17 transposase